MNALELRKSSFVAKGIDGIEQVGAAPLPKILLTCPVAFSCKVSGIPASVTEERLEAQQVYRFYS